MQAGQSGAADGVLRQHALDGQLHGELGTLGHDLVVLDFLEVANPTGVMVVGLLLQLLAGQDGLVNVDNDDIVAAVNIRGEINFVLAAQQLGSGHSSAAQGLAGCVKNVPFSLDVLLLCHSGHEMVLRFLLERYRTIPQRRPCAAHGNCAVQSLLS